MSELTQAARWMREALKEAENARACGEVPVGAVIVVGGRVVARAHNEVERQHDATCHAELLAIKRATEMLGDWRLSNASLFVTLEPCPMCIGAILLSRIDELYFGCYDPRQGAVGSVFDLSDHPGLPHSTTVYPEVLADECSDLLTTFFQERRAAATTAPGMGITQHCCPAADAIFTRRGVRVV